MRSVVDLNGVSVRTNDLRKIIDLIPDELMADRKPTIPEREFNVDTLDNTNDLGLR